MISLDAKTGMPLWGKYYQSSNHENYIGIFYTCKYSRTSNYLIVAGQINFYIPFVGTFDIETGDPIKVI